MENSGKKKERVKHIFEILDPLYTREKTALKYRTPFQLLISTILSAQCTDKQVNSVTKTLFKKYKNPQAFRPSVPTSRSTVSPRPCLKSIKIPRTI
jgi:endonuclease-3